MSDYSKITDFASKDALSTGNPAKIATGTSVDNEFNAIAVAIATKANSASPNLTTPNIGVASGTSLALSGSETIGGTLSVTGGITATAGITGNLTGNVTGNADTATNAVNITGSGTISATTTGGAGLTPTTSTNAVNITGSGTISATTTGGNALTPTSLLQGTQGYTLATPQTTTSGTTFDFSIPAWATRIYVFLRGVSTINASGVMLQIGDATGVKTTGYLGSGTTITSAANYTTGFGLEQNGNATFLRHGMATLRLMTTAHIWACTSVMGTSDSASVNHGAGTGSTSTVLTTVRLTTIDGSAFDAGSVNVAYE